MPNNRGNQNDKRGSAAMDEKKQREIAHRESEVQVYLASVNQLQETEYGRPLAVEHLFESAVRRTIPVLFASIMA